jgi:hypothetical protein
VQMILLLRPELNTLILNPRSEYSRTFTK